MYAVIVVIVAVVLHKHRGVEDVHFDSPETIPFLECVCFNTAAIVDGADVALVIPLEMKIIINK